MSFDLVIGDIHFVAEKQVKLSQSCKIQVQAVGYQADVILICKHFETFLEMLPLKQKAFLIILPLRLLFGLWCLFLMKISEVLDHNSAELRFFNCKSSKCFFPGCIGSTALSRVHRGYPILQIQYNPSSQLQKFNMKSQKCPQCIGNLHYFISNFQSFH